MQKHLLTLGIKEIVTMLTNQEVLLLQRLRAHLAGTKKLQKDEVNEVLTDLDTALLASARQAADRAKPRTTRGQGRPPIAFAVEMEPGWRSVVHGIRAAAELVNTTLTDLKLRGGPSQQVLSVALSRNGYWMRLVETDNGTASLTVRRCAEPDSPAG